MSNFAAVLGRGVIGAAALAALLIVLVGLVGNGDYEAALSEEVHYKRMVCAGTWPDYQRIKPDCAAVERTYQQLEQHHDSETN